MYKRQDEALNRLCNIREAGFPSARLPLQFLFMAAAAEHHGDSVFSSGGEFVGKEQACLLYTSSCV